MEQVIVPQWALESTKNWDKKKEALRKAVTEFNKSEKTTADYMGLIYVSNFALKPDNGLVWSEVQSIISEVLNA